MFRRKVIRNQEVPVDPNAYQSTNPAYQYIPAGIDMVATEGESATDVLGNPRSLVFRRAPIGSFTSPENFTKYNAIVRNRQNQMSTSGKIIDELKQGLLDAVYGITKPVETYMESREAEAFKQMRGEIEQNGGYIRNQNAVGTSLPGYGGFAGPGLPANIDADSDGIPDSYDSLPDSTGGSFVFDTPTTTTESTTSPMVPFVPDTVASLPNMRQFNPYQNVGFGLSTALTSDSAGERRAGAVLTGLAGASSAFDLGSNLLLGRGANKEITDMMAEADRTAGLDFQSPIMDQTEAVESALSRTGFAQDGTTMYKKGGKSKKKNKPNDSALWSRAIAAAKKKFDVYPSAYANAWAVQWYKKKGGTWRKAQDGFVYEEGGQITIEEQLSGRNVTGIARPELSGTEINAELEKNEYVEYPEEQKISKVIGKSHAQGGEKMNLEPGTRILSDNIKVGAEYKKALSDLFDMKNIKANDTVAKVMEKYLEKSGVTAIQKRQEEVLKGLKENMSVKDEATRRTNEQFYADKIIKTQAELNEKQKEQTLVFNVLFQMQEARKAKNEQGDPSAKNIRKRPPLEQEFVPYEGPPPVEEETAQPVEVALENGGTIDILMDGTKIYASPEAIEIVRRDALEGGYGDFMEYLSENVVGKLADGGGIPERYKKKGFRKVGVKKRAPSGSKHKWEVLARKKVGGKTRYKIVKGGFRGMKDFTQHKDKKRQKSFWDRMGGKNSAKTKDPFSPLYWHKRFGTWEDGGKLDAKKNFKPHWMYDPNNPNKAEFAEKYEDHVRLDKIGYIHEKPKIEDFEYGGMSRYQSANQVEIIVDADGNRYIPQFRDRETGQVVYADAQGNYVVPGQMTTENSTFNANAQGIYGAGRYGYDELDDVGKSKLDESSGATADYVAEQYNKTGNVQGLTVNVFGASSKTPVSPDRQKKIFQDLGYEQIGSNQNRFRVPDLANDPTGQTFIEVTVGTPQASDAANYGLPILRTSDQVSKLKEDLLARGIPQEQIDQIAFNTQERAMIGPEYGGEGVRREDPKYMGYQNSGFSVDLAEDKQGMTPYGYMEEIPQQEFDFEIPNVGASLSVPALDFTTDLVRPSIGIATTPLQQQARVDLQPVKYSEEQALREGAAATNLAMRQSANMGGPEARTAALGSQSIRSQYANEATLQRQEKDAESVFKTDLAEAQLNSPIDSANLTRQYQYSTNALKAVDNEISAIADFEKAVLERADQKERFANTLSVMGQFAPNFMVTPSGPVFNPGTQADILYPYASNIAQQILASSGLPAAQQFTQNT